MNWINVYKDIYKKYSKITPLYFDCGELCNRKCCDTSKESYMMLFPHEDEYIKSIETDYKIIESNGYKYINCGGVCNREYRPLSCVIFPLFPYLDDDGRLNLDIDLRSKNYCPLALDNMEELKLQPLFRLKLFKLFYELIKYEEFNEFIKKISKDITELEKFYN